MYYWFSFQRQLQWMSTLKARLTRFIPRMKKMLVVCNYPSVVSKNPKPWYFLWQQVKCHIVTFRSGPLLEEFLFYLDLSWVSVEYCCCRRIYSPWGWTDSLWPHWLQNLAVPSTIIWPQPEHFIFRPQWISEMEETSLPQAGIKVPPCFRFLSLSISPN